MVYCAPHQGMSLSRSISSGLANRPLHEGGLLGQRALPGDDQPGEGINDEGGVAKAGSDGNVGEVRNVELVRFGSPEVPLDEIGGTRPIRVRDRRYDPLLPCHPPPAVAAHEPLHGAARDRYTGAQEVCPHLGGSVKGLRLAASILVGFVVAGQDLGDGGIPQAALGRSAPQVGVIGPRGDRTTVLGKHAADRSDPEGGSMLGNESTDHRCRGSLSRAKKVVAAFKMATVCSSSAFLRLSSRI